MTLAEAEKRYLPWLMQNLSGFIAVVDLSATIRYISPSVERVLERRQESLIGRHISYVVHPDDVRAASERLIALPSLAGTTWSVVFRAKAQSGAWRLLRATAIVGEHDGCLLAAVSCQSYMFVFGFRNSTISRSAQ